VVCKHDEATEWMLMKADDYILFDCPGQVELFTHHNSLRNIFYRLQKLGYRVSLEPCERTLL
jgi:hypothetical protein